MPIPTYEHWMRPLLERADHTPRRLRDITQEIADAFGLTEEERIRMLPAGRATVLASRAGWARTYLKQAGLLELPMPGCVSITDRGRAALASNTPINNAYLRQFAEFRAFEERSRSKAHDHTTREIQTDSTEDTPEDRLDAAASEIDTALQSTLLDAVRKLSPTSFELLIIALLKAMNYGARGAVLHLGKTADGGVDGVIQQDALGLDRVYMQAKRYAASNTVGSPEIDKFSGALSKQNAQKGVFVTTSSFSDAARNAKYNNHTIVLIDGDELARLLVQYNVGVEPVRTIALKRIDLGAFEDEGLG